MFIPRPKQAEVLAYTGGRMGVSAVPGSGKTHVLSALAARLIAGAGLADDQEVLVVTLVNSAVDNFGRRLGAFLAEQRLILGYRVRTLHGLAHDIVRERPALAGLPMTSRSWTNETQPKSCRTRRTLAGHSPGRWLALPRPAARRPQGRVGAA